MSTKEYIIRAFQGLEKYVKLIVEQLSKIVKEIRFEEDQGEYAHYKIADELWLFYKGLRDEENYILAYLCLLLFKKKIKDWELTKHRQPSYKHYELFKSTKNRYKKINDELAVCSEGIKSLLIQMCIKENIIKALPLSGDKDKFQKIENTKTSKFMVQTFNNKFKNPFDPERYISKHPVLKSHFIPVLRPLDKFDNSIVDVGSDPTNENLLIAEEASTNLSKTKSKKKASVKFVKIPLGKNIKFDVLEKALPVEMLDTQFANSERTLNKADFTLIRTRADNHALFRSIAYSLSLGRLTPQSEARDIFKLREVCCTELVNNLDEPLLSDGTTVRMEMCRLQNSEDFSVYVKKLRFLRKGDVLELWALSRALKLRISVFEKVVLDQPTVNNKKILDFFKHLATYGMQFKESEEILIYRNGRGSFGSLLPLKSLKEEQSRREKLKAQISTPVVNELDEAELENVSEGGEVDETEREIIELENVHNPTEIELTSNKTRNTGLDIQGVNENVEDEEEVVAEVRNIAVDE